MENEVKKSSSQLNVSRLVGTTQRKPNQRTEARQPQTPNLKHQTL